ncbi:hypothetical protein [Dolichospermum sp. LEGE 00240]|uniref:hypothetical protein n=1 Tax=Dolichospermum sp. LEGE 00240 TaxID=1828603 RepID=UPI0018812109|nr:hypothetical protein [Dolichospermum sp. LEGE 00240]
MGCGSAIAQNWGSYERSLFGDVGCDSEALLQAVRLKLGGCERSLFGDVGRAIAKRCCKQFV